MWLDLESVIQSEVNQKEENKYLIWMHIYGIYKNGTNEPISRADGESGHVDTGRKGKVEWIGRLGLTYSTSVKQLARGNLL